MSSGIEPGIERYEAAERALLTRGIGRDSIVVLTKDVTNPTPDRRNHRDWRKQEIIAAKSDPTNGKSPLKRFRVIAAGKGEGLSVLSYLFLRRIDQTPRYFSDVLLTEDLFDRMLPHLEPVEETIDDALRSIQPEDPDIGAGIVLSMLVSTGRIDKKDVFAMAQKFRDEQQHKTGGSK